MKIGTIGTNFITDYILENIEKTEGLSCGAVYSRKEETGRKLAEEFSLSAVVITGVDQQEEGEAVKMGNLVLENGKCSWVFAEKAGGSYSGTGDIFASILSAGLVKGYSMEACADMAVDFISASIRDAVKEGTDRNDGVCFELHLGRLVR